MLNQNDESAPRGTQVERSERLDRKHQIGDDVTNKERVPMLDERQQRDLVTRLNRIEGQIRGIRRMIEEPRLCVEILQQLAAAEAGLARVSHSILKFHVEKCVPKGIENGGSDQIATLSELVDIFDRFSR